MISLFNRLFGLRGSASSPKPLVKTNANVEIEAQASRFSDGPSTVEDNSENGLRSQLIHVLLRDALRRYGLPPHWIACQLLLVSSRRRGAGMFVRLVVKHWDERLMQHLMAFEKAFRADVERFEPLAKEWLHGISWQIEPLNACPYLEMPDRTFWQGAPAAPSTSPASASATARKPEPARAAHVAAVVIGTGAYSGQPVSASDAPAPARSDIEQLFASRDRELAQHNHDFGAIDYQKTEPSSL